jgi:hypothetical protein
LWSWPFCQLGQRFNGPLLGIEGLVGNQCLGQQEIAAEASTDFAAPRVKADRVARRVNEGADLGAQAAALNRMSQAMRFPQ